MNAQRIRSLMNTNVRAQERLIRLSAPTLKLDYLPSPVRPPVATAKLYESISIRDILACKAIAANRKQEVHQ